MQVHLASTCGALNQWSIVGHYVGKHRRDSDSMALMDELKDWRKSILPPMLILMRFKGKSKCA